MKSLKRMITVLFANLASSIFLILKSFCIFHTIALQRVSPAVSPSMALLISVWLLLIDLNGFDVLSDLF
jgi:hypothetical protein